MPVYYSRYRYLDLEYKTTSRADAYSYCVALNALSLYNVRGNDLSILRAVFNEKKRLNQEERDTLAKLLRLKD